MEDQDFSRKTIFVLVLLTVIVSLLGTGLVLYEVNTAKIASRPATAQAQVSFEIIEPGTQQSATNQATGYVALEILGET
jgi:hypothetical protein